MVPGLRAPANGTPSEGRGGRRPEATESSARARRELQADRPSAKAGRSPRVPDRAPLARPRGAPVAGGRGAGPARLHGGFFPGEGLRTPGVYAALRRSHPRSRPAVVQHGGLREPRQAGSPPAPTQGTSTVGWKRGRSYSTTSGTPRPPG